MTLWAEGLQIAADGGNEYEAALQDAPPAAHGHSSQSKEHRYLPIAIPLPITISRRKDWCLVINGL
nr:hypothetical protein [uncultured Dialister sp.]